MKPKIPIEELLRWRFKVAKFEAPAPPSAAHLLELANGWWEKYPDEFQAFVAQLKKIQLREDPNIVKPRRRRGHRIAALVVSGTSKSQGSVQVRHFRLGDGELNFSFEMENKISAIESSVEVTFISHPAARLLFCALATASADGKCSIKAKLPANLAQNWVHLKPADRMPFRLILRF
jgi:hypothetical protein